MENQLHCEIVPTWNIIKSIVLDLKDILPPSNKELVYITRMVVSELLENAIKYGSEKNIIFDFALNGDLIIVTVSNYVDSQIHSSNLKKTIDVINSSPDIKSLYINRLEQLKSNMENGTAVNEATMLGLYRIVYEGGFSLRYQFNDQQLTMTATRQIF